MTRLDDARLLCERGWSVFPCNADKTPIGEAVKHGHQDATNDPRRAKVWWRAFPDALIGVAVPDGMVIVDIDDPAAFGESGYDLPETFGQDTQREGGAHFFYKYPDGYPPLKQMVKKVPGADTRVGGKGYVVAWQPANFPDLGVASIPDAPDWLWDVSSFDGDEADEVRQPSDAAKGERVVLKIGERDNRAASIVGSMHRQGIAPEIIRMTLLAMRDGGQIESSREEPFTDRDVNRIVRSITGYRSEAAETQASRPKASYSLAADLINQDIDPLEYFIDGILPEGFGVIAGAPKVGKSWLVLQAAVEIATGGALLGHGVIEARPVLYFALEDGPRRMQSRLQILIAKRDITLDKLQIAYVAPAITEGLEGDISAWLKEHDHGLVIIDVLAKVRPAAGGKGSAYDEDYKLFGPIQNVIKAHKGSGIAVVTHKRKQGADDPLATIQGTTGVSGSADWTWMVDRARLKTTGEILVVGRDIASDMSIAAEFAAGWSLSTKQTAGKSAEQNLVLEALQTDGPMTSREIAAFLNHGEPASPDDRRAANAKVIALAKEGLVDRGDYDQNRGGYMWRYKNEDERRAEIEALKQSQHDLQVRREIEQS